MATIADVLAAKGGDVYTVTPETTVFDAIAAMTDHGVGSLLVMDGRRLAGIVTERDYLRKVALQGRSSRETPVRAIMSDKLICVTPDHDVEEALAVMTEARIRHLPVLGEGGLVGLVSMGDCVKQVNRERATQIRYLTDFIRDGYPG